jgi:hypothetical protein
MYMSKNVQCVQMYKSLGLNKSDTMERNEMKINVQIKIDSSEKNCEELRMPSPFYF